MHYEFFHDVNSFWLRHVERNIFLPHILLNEICRERIHPGVGKPCEVAIGWFNFDDFGTEVAQHACGMGAGKYTAEIENTQALQWALRLLRCR